MRVVIIYLEFLHGTQASWYLSGILRESNYAIYMYMYWTSRGSEEVNTYDVCEYSEYV